MTLLNVQYRCTSHCLYVFSFKRLYFATPWVISLVHSLSVVGRQVQVRGCWIRTHVAALVALSAFVLDVEGQRGRCVLTDTVVEQALSVAGRHQPVRRC